VANYESERKSLDAAIQEEETGHDLIVLGGTVASMTAITCLFIWVGWRAGTWFWFWWTSALALLGTGLAMTGALLRAHSAKKLAALGGIRREESPARHGGEATPPHDAPPRAA
jgi:fatty acid desaturase